MKAVNHVPFRKEPITFCEPIFLDGMRFVTVYGSSKIELEQRIRIIKRAFNLEDNESGKKNG